MFICLTTYCKLNKYCVLIHLIPINWPPLYIIIYQKRWSIGAGIALSGLSRRVVGLWPYQQIMLDVWFVATFESGVKCVLECAIRRGVSSSPQRIRLAGWRGDGFNLTGVVFVILLFCCEYRCKTSSVMQIQSLRKPWPLCTTNWYAQWPLRWIVNNISNRTHPLFSFAPRNALFAWQKANKSPLFTHFTWVYVLVLFGMEYTWSGADAEIGIDWFR